MKHSRDLRKYMWFELALWLIILLIVILGVRFHNMNNLKKLNSYQIFMPDVDGVIKGSPVKYLGVQVGYVDKIKILKDTIYLKLIITDKNVTFPKGVIATVEFSGMGGSKSIEIYPPTVDSKNSGNLIYVIPPKRLHDSLGLLNDMYDKINSISTKMSFFASETGVIDAGKGLEFNKIGDNVSIMDSIIKELGEFHAKRKINK